MSASAMRIASINLWFKCTTENGSVDNFNNINKENIKHTALFSGTEYTVIVKSIELNEFTNPSNQHGEDNSEIPLAKPSEIYNWVDKENNKGRNR